MTNHDSLIDKIFWKDGKLMNAHKRKVSINNHINIKNYLSKRYVYIENLTESIIRIHFNINDEDRPLCKYCKGPAKFNNRVKPKIYQDYCCNSCAAKGTNRGHNWYENQRKINIEKYGVECNFFINGKEKTIAKRKNTCLVKYGVDNFIKTNKFKEIATNTKRKNHTFNASKPEEELFLYIKSKFPSVRRQYKDKERYPYNCDFYIPELDYFIELQGFYTHNTHPYNPNSIEDQILVERYKAKYGPSCQAITIWTIKDVEKRNCAKEHNLNFKEVWTLNEGKHFVDKLYNKMLT